MSNGQMFRTTTHVSSRDRSAPIPPDAVITAADLDPAADVGWMVKMGSLVPVAAGLTLVSDAPTAEALVGEVGRLQEIVEQQAALIDRRDSELAALREQLAAATVANPLPPSKVSSGEGPVGSFGSDKASANPRAGRAPAAPPKLSAVTLDAAGRVVANPDRPRTIRMGDSQPTIIPRAGDVPGVVAAANASVGAVTPAAAVPQFDPNADAVAAVRAENEAMRAKMGDMMKAMDELRAKLSPTPPTQPGLDGQTEFLNPASLNAVA